tara:strand:- start:133 stop:429 length:297 start_codon:yes stop_codon:yes gene_type:complete
LRPEEINRGDILVRYDLIPYREIARYIVLDKVGYTPRNAEPSYRKTWTFGCALLSYNPDYYQPSQQAVDIRNIPAWMFNVPEEEWITLFKSDLSWERE